MTDIEKEGTWRWVNGEVSVHSEEGWDTNEPGGGQNENCAIIFPTKRKDQNLHDNGCNGSFQGLCENTD